MNGATPPVKPSVALDAVTEVGYQIFTFFLIISALISCIIIPIANLIMVSIPIMILLTLKALMGFVSGGSLKDLTKKAPGGGKGNIYAMLIAYFLTPMTNAEYMALMLGWVLLPAAAFLTLGFIASMAKYACDQNIIAKLICSFN